MTSMPLMERYADNDDGSGGGSAHCDLCKNNVNNGETVVEGPLDDHTAIRLSDKSPEQRRLLILYTLFVENTPLY